jgi:hypothetical protein
MMKTPHKHAALIKAWADGAKIQVSGFGLWIDVPDNQPQWSTECDYRVKPEPKPDVVKYAVAYKHEIACLGSFNTNPNNNVMFVFDGETGVLKDVQLLARE